MRTRDEILESIDVPVGSSIEVLNGLVGSLALEVLLDIRELLISKA